MSSTTGSQPPPQAQVSGHNPGDKPGPAPGQEPSITHIPRDNALMGVPIEIVISVGRARPLVSDLLRLRRDSVIALDSRVEDPVEICIGDRVIARGELHEIEEGTGKLGVRLTEVADIADGV